MNLLLYYLKKAASIIFILLFLMPTAQAASFNCEKAATKIEKLICSDDELSKLDESLNDAYLKALNRKDIKKKTIESQKQWLKKERNVCQDAECIKRAYENRIKELGFSSSYGIVFLREPGKEKSREEQIHFGSPVRANLQNSNNLLPLSSSQPPRELAAHAEVILISGYEPSNQNKVGTIVKVEVDRPGSKVLLILTSYEKINWQVNASPSTIISGIVTWGYKAPTVTTSNPTQGFLVNLPYAYETENVNYKNLLNKLNSMFGISKIDVFRGSYSIPSVVRISSLDPPRVELTQEGPSPQKPNRNFTFEIIGRDFKKEAWSLTGPVQANEVTETDFKKAVRPPAELDQEEEDENESNIMEEKIAVSKRSNEIFRLRGDDLEIFNRIKGKSEIAPLPPNFPRFSWAMDIAYDSRRDIVTVVTLGGEGFLYRFDAKRKKWIDFRSLNDIDICSLSYDKSKDRYVAWGTFGSNGQLFFISGEGNALFKRNILPKLVGLGRLYDRGNGPSPCLKIAPNGNEIALIFMNGNIVKSIWCYYVENDTAVLTYKN